MFAHDNKTIRELSYRSVIPFYIIFDLDLDAHHYRLYSLIEQMESNPNPKVTPTFSYEWFAKLVGIEKRAAMRIAKKLKDKNYIRHYQIKSGKNKGLWLWETIKKSVIDNSGVACEDTPGVACEDTPGVACEDTQTTNKNKNYKDKTTKLLILPKPTTLVSSSFFFSQSIDKNIINEKLQRDERNNEQFLAVAQDHVDNHSDKKYSRLQRANALVKLLKNLKKDNIMFNCEEKQMEEKLHKAHKKMPSHFTKEELRLISEYKHAKQGGVDRTEIFFPNPEIRERAKTLVKKAMEYENSGRVQTNIEQVRV